MTYGNGKFIAIGKSVSIDIAHSSDGINWSAVTSTEAQNCYAITYGNGMYLTVTYTGNTCQYSYDATTWNTVTLPSSSWLSVVFGAGKFVAVPDYGNTVICCDVRKPIQ